MTLFPIEKHLGQRSSFKQWSAICAPRIHTAFLLSFSKAHKSTTAAATLFVEIIISVCGPGAMGVIGLSPVSDCLHCCRNTGVVIETLSGGVAESAVTIIVWHCTALT